MDVNYASACWSGIFGEKPPRDELVVSKV